MNGAQIGLLVSLAVLGGCRSQAVQGGGSPAGSASGSRWLASEGRELVGTQAPEWRGLVFVQGGPLSLAALRGKLVLLRFWLVDCGYCKATAPALNELHERYASRGLTVVGIHHPKSDAARDLERVRRTARELGFEFPVAHDDEWPTVRAYGVGSAFKRFTSVSVLVDRDGRIAWVHDGGEFHRGGSAGHEDCNRAFDTLDGEIERRVGGR